MSMGPGRPAQADVKKLPEPTEDDIRLGWKNNYDLLSEVEDEINKGDLGYVTMETVEAIIMALKDRGYLA